MTERGPQADRLIELERSQIGHEIHDSLIPLITTAAAAVEIARNSDDPNHRQEKLDLAIQLLDRAGRAGRELLTEIYPPELTAMSWMKAVEDTIDRLCPKSKTEISFDIESLRDLDLPLASAAYRIVVEAVRNAVRHAQASRVLVCAEAGPPRAIRIQDDGQGFDPQSVSEDRFGVRTMRGRAELVGGSLKVTSNLGSGTVIRFELP